MSEYRLVMKGVVKTFPGVKALDHAQLELRPGKVMALMGENGAGKSTLMKCMFGIYKMDEGEIEYEGEKVTITTPLDALNRGIAMVHQELQPIPARTVAENIKVVGALRKCSGTSSEPDCCASVIACLKAVYTALLLGAHAKYTTACAMAKCPSGLPRRS